MAVNTAVEALREKVAKGEDLTAEEITLLLSEHDALKERLSKRYGSSNYWEKQKARMEADPEYAEKIKEQRKDQGQKQRAKRQAEREELEQLRALYKS